MANFTELESTVSGLFGVLGTLVSEFVDLLINNLVELIIIGVIIGAVVKITRGVSESTVKNTKLK